MQCRRSRNERITLRSQIIEQDNQAPGIFLSRTQIFSQGNFVRSVQSLDWNLDIPYKDTEFVQRGI